MSLWPNLLLTLLLGRFFSTVDSGPLISSISGSFDLEAEIFGFSVGFGAKNLSSFWSLASVRTMFLGASEAAGAALFGFEGPPSVGFFASSSVGKMFPGGGAPC